MGGVYGHEGSLRVEGLVKVPWVIRKDEKKEAKYKELDIEKKRVKTQI